MSGPLAIVSAMKPELAALLPLLSEATVEEAAGRRLHRGRLQAQQVVLVLCGIGKVAAALTTTLLVERCGVSAILFTGVAGGLGASVRVGDVVVARSVLQHDLDASPIFPRHHIPDLGCAELTCDPRLSEALAGAAAALQAERGAAVHEGLVVSGDRFVSTTPESEALKQRLPQALAVEMEGAAMAQVCAAYGVPCAMVRTISDRADDEAPRDFNRFLTEVASPLSRDIVMNALRCL